MTGNVEITMAEMKTRGFGSVLEGDKKATNMHVHTYYLLFTYPIFMMAWGCLG
jgi:hypothetical protein